MKAPFLDSAIVAELRRNEGKLTKTQLCVNLGATAWHIDQAIQRLRVAGKLEWTGGPELRPEFMERANVVAIGRRPV